MEAIWTVRDIAARYKCSMQCARNYIRKMANYMESPLAVYESDLMEWERSRMVIKATERRRDTAPPERLIVPRTR